jgi:hypothetical protein
MRKAYPRVVSALFLVVPPLAVAGIREQGERGLIRRLRLAKRDTRRAIDHIIDYFGETPVRHLRLAPVRVPIERIPARRS